MSRPAVSWPKLVSDLVPRCSFPPAGAALSCAVSGGPDSLALMVLAAAAGCAVTAIHVSVLPDPDDGGVRILGRMANGGTGSVTFYGRVIAAKLPFADRVIRLQYLGSTRSVGITLTAYK